MIMDLNKPRVLNFGVQLIQHRLCSRHEWFFKSCSLLGLKSSDLWFCLVDNKMDEKSNRLATCRDQNNRDESQQETPSNTIATTHNMLLAANF